jgi:WD40 repeat protein
MQEQDSVVCEDNATYWNRWEQDADARRFRNPEPPEIRIAVSPDGTRLAFATLREVIIYDAATLIAEHTLRTTLYSPLSQNMSISWSPDSQYLAVAQYIPAPEATDPHSGVYIWDIESEEILNVMPTEPELIAWSPDGHSIAVLTLGMTASPALQVWDPEMLDEVYTYNFSTPSSSSDFRASALAWSPDSTQLAGTTYSIDLLGLWDINRQELQIHMLPPGSGGENLAWSPVGNDLAIANSVRSSIQLWNTETREIDEGKTLSNAIGPVLDIQWSPDGRWLAQAGQLGMSLWDMTSDNTEPTRSFDENVPPFARIAWLPDSQHLISVDFEGSIYRWDVETGCVEAAVLKEWQP